MFLVVHEYPRGPRGGVPLVKSRDQWPVLKFNRSIVDKNFFFWRELCTLGNLGLLPPQTNSDSPTTEAACLDTFLNWKEPIITKLKDVLNVCQNRIRYNFNWQNLHGLVNILTNRIYLWLIFLWVTLYLRCSHLFWCFLHHMT